MNTEKNKQMDEACSGNTPLSPQERQEQKIKSLQSDLITAHTDLVITQDKLNKSDKALYDTHKEKDRIRGELTEQFRESLIDAKLIRRYKNTQSILISIIVGLIISLIWITMFYIDVKEINMDYRQELNNYEAKEQAKNR